MLSNKDFASMVSSGADLTRSEDGKIRFDMKQIKQWDKQNKFQDKRRQGQSKGKNVFGDDQDEDPQQQKSFLPAGYRDRALERRKGGVPQSTEDRHLEDIVQEMDIEQSKFLGGDVEHTHLVKGLDFALLAKMREQREGEGEEGSEGEESAPSSHPPSDEEGSAFTLHTDMGKRLHKLLFPTVSAPQAEEKREAYVRLDLTPHAPPGGSGGRGAVSTSSSSYLQPTLSKAAQLLSRTVFEFDLQTGEVVTTVQGADKKGKGKEKKREGKSEGVIYYLSADLHKEISKICALGGGSLKPPSKRKHNNNNKPSLLTPLPAPPLPSSVSATLPTPPVGSIAPTGGKKIESIYEEEVGDYTPLPEDSLPPSAHPPSSLQGLFKNLKGGIEQKAEKAEKGGGIGGLVSLLRGAEGQGADLSLLKPVKQLLKARPTESLYTSLPVPKGAGGTKGEGNKVKYRDVFASTLNKVVEHKAEELKGVDLKGQAFGEGSYDYYGGGEDYDSEEGEGEGAKRPRKKSKAGGEGR